MNDKNINKTFDINDLYSSTDQLPNQSLKNKPSISSEIHHELELSEMYQKKRLFEKIEKRLYYQNEIENLRKKMKEPIEKKDTHLKETILNMKNEFQNSQNLSKSLNELLQSEYALRNRLSEHEMTKERKNLSKAPENEIEIKKSSILKQEEEEKLKVKTKKSEEKLWRKENFEDNENFEILKPVHHDPFKKVLARKEELKEKKEVLDQKEERKKLYRRYLQLLKMKKEIIESKGYFSLYFYHFFSVDIKENVDLEKIFNEIVELKLKSFFLL